MLYVVSLNLIVKHHCQLCRCTLLMAGKDDNNNVIPPLHCQWQQILQYCKGAVLMPSSASSSPDGVLLSLLATTRQQQQQG